MTCEDYPCCGHPAGRCPTPARSTVPPKQIATAIYFDGPHSDTNRDGDEVPSWTVYAGDGFADPVGKIYHVSAYDSALILAQRMAKDRRLELVVDATRD